MIATWKMAENGVNITADLLSAGAAGRDAVLEGIADAEDNPNYHSVGYSGRPNREGRVFLDGGFMDGDTLHFGAVGAVEGYRSAVRIARSLADREANNFLVGRGAEEYAASQGFERRDNVTPDMTALYEAEKEKRKKLSAYDGHDTVCFLTLDQQGSLCAAASTSGLFMKDPGRLGDTPVCGSGFYADSETGAAAATGMGEEIMKGSLSYAAVSLMKLGMSPAEAAQKAVNDLNDTLIRRNGHAEAMSLICMNRNGETGVGTNIPFTFVTADEEHKTQVFEAVPGKEGIVIHKL